MFVPLIIAVPFVALTLMIVNASPSGSLSLLNAGTVTGTFTAVLAVLLTATGGRFVTAVIAGGLMLFVGVLSRVGLSTVATFVMAPRKVVVTVNVRLVNAPAAKLFRFVQTT